MIMLLYSDLFGYTYFISLTDQYKPSRYDLQANYPTKYRTLYNKVKHHLSEQEFDAVMFRKAGIELDSKHRGKLEFIASPGSVKKQEQQHKDWVSVLVNPKTLKQGQRFFNKNKHFFKAASAKTGVVPGDIIAVLNWESRLGKYRGTYTVFKLFVGKYFYIDAIERKIYKAGGYNKKDAMPRADALKRIAKIKRSALKNLSQLLIIAQENRFDPFKVKGSWAGAIGIPQFMPASIKFARDSDGVIDLNTMPDAIMSVAFYLKAHNYHQKGKKAAFMRHNPEKRYVRGVVPTKQCGSIKSMG